MPRREWEVIIQEIVDECGLAQTERGGNRILMKWRAKLGKEPFLLKPFEIDEIVREIRRRVPYFSR